MPRKGTSIQTSGDVTLVNLSQISPYILAFLVLLIGGASIASFIGMIIAAFKMPLLCLPLSGMSTLTLRIAYSVIEILLRPGKSMPTAPSGAHPRPDLCPACFYQNAAGQNRQSEGA